MCSLLLIDLFSNDFSDRVSFFDRNIGVCEFRLGCEQVSEEAASFAEGQKESWWSGKTTLLLNLLILIQPVFKVSLL